jgi:hypothetical protein
MYSKPGWYFSAYFGIRRDGIELGLAGENDNVTLQTVTIKIERHVGANLDVVQLEGARLAVYKKGPDVPPDPDQPRVRCSVRVISRQTFEPVEEFPLQFQHLDQADSRFWLL